MSRLIDLSGKKFGSLLALSKVDGYSRTMWACVCSCGVTTVVQGQHLRSGHTKSCGCLVEKHGLEHTNTYNTWVAMKQRCLNQNSPDYARYGGRGITICDDWLDFINFFTDMGERPEGRTLDRVDNNRGYSKANCRWATPSEQASNRRPAKR